MANRRSSRRKVDYYLLEDSDSDNDFTPVRKKSKKEVVPPVKSTSIAAVPSTTKRLSRDEKLFQQQMKAAVSASLGTATESIVIVNPGVDSSRDCDKENGKESCTTEGVNSSGLSVDPLQQRIVEPCGREGERQEQTQGAVQTTSEPDSKQPALHVTKPPRRRWNPPGAVSSGVRNCNNSSTGSPPIRVGLSRNAKIKPLHKVK